MLVKSSNYVSNMTGNEEFFAFSVGSQVLKRKHNKHFVYMLCLPCYLNGKFEQHSHVWAVGFELDRLVF